jgi:hypothetical protein
MTSPPPMFQTDALTRVWFGALKRPWLSLAVVPGHPDSSAVPLARALADAGVRCGQGPLAVMSAQEVGVELTIAHLMRMHEGPTQPPPGVIVEPYPPEPYEPKPLITPTTSGSTDLVVRDNGQSSQFMQLRQGRVIVAVDSVLSKPSGLGVVLAADVALLCIHMQATSLKSARRTIEMIGRDRFIGCITLRPV